jgi:hypothetical protein
MFQKNNETKEKTLLSFFFIEILRAHSNAIWLFVLILLISFFYSQEKKNKTLSQSAVRKYCIEMMRFDFFLRFKLLFVRHIFS